MRTWIEMAHEKRAHIFPTYWYWLAAQEVGKTIGAEPGLYGNWYKDHEMSYITTPGGFNNVGKVILEKLESDKSLLEKIEEINIKEIPPLLKLSEWFAEKDLTEVSGQELLDQHDKVLKQFLKLMVYSLMGTLIEFEEPLLSGKVENIISNKVEEDTLKVGEYFNILSTPARKTIPKTEEVALRRLKIKKLENKLADREIEEHTKEYSYIVFNYDGPGWSVEEIKERLDELSEDVDVLLKEIDEIEKMPSIIKKEQERVITELGLNEQEIYTCHILQVLGYWKFERKLANQKSHEYMELFFEELMRRFHLSKAQAKMILPSEMKTVLVDEKVDIDILNQRVKQCVALFEGYDKRHVLVGKEAEDVEKEIEESLAVDPGLKECKGTCAYPGQAKGRVVRIDEEKDMAKFQDGDILVSTSTMPKLVSVMKRASAIVTDAGGITCHAAIVSREIQVPCVIGTKIATRFLKDGDQVEVDATSGIVKKL